MARGTHKRVEPTGIIFPLVFETFERIGQFDLSRLRKDAPSCFNGNVEVERYRITVEKVEEPLELIHDRLRKLYAEGDNFHHVEPLKAAAKKFGLELDPLTYGSARRRKT